MAHNQNRSFSVLQFSEFVLNSDFIGILKVQYNSVMDSTYTSGRTVSVVARLSLEKACSDQVSINGNEMEVMRK